MLDSKNLNLAIPSTLSYVQKSKMWFLTIAFIVKKFYTNGEKNVTISEFIIMAFDLDD